MRSHVGANARTNVVSFQIYLLTVTTKSINVARNTTLYYAGVTFS